MPLPRPWASLFCAANPFKVTWSEQVFFSDAPTECLHRDFVGRRRTGTRHGNVYRSVREKQGIVYRQRVLQTVTSLCVSFTSFSRSEFINLSRAQRAYRARIASELRFRFGHKSLYRLGIRSCLATSHKQILKTPYSTWRHRDFWVSRQHVQRLGLILCILCLLYFGKSQNISEANNRRWQTQQCPTGQVAGNPCRGRFNTERTVTWTSAKAAKKKTSPLIERPI